MTRPAFDWATTFVEATLAYRARCIASGVTAVKPSPVTSGFEGAFVLRDDAGIELARYACDGLGRVEAT